MSHDPQRSGWCSCIALLDCSDNADTFSEHLRTGSIFIDFPFASKEAEAEVAWQQRAVGFLLAKVIDGRVFFFLRLILFALVLCSSGDWSRLGSW